MLGKNKAKFLQESSEIFPVNAYSCLAEHTEQLPFTTREWCDLMGVKDPIIDQDLIVAGLESQLGGLWGTPLSKPIKTTIMLLCGHIANLDMTVFSEDIQIWALNNNFEDDPTPYWYPGLMDATLEASGPILYRIAQHHAYQYTVLMELVSEAKKTGFVNAHYLWLKAMSYRAWLLIDHYGRREPVINIFGITTHWLCEKSHRGKLTETHFGSMEDKSSALWALMESFNQ